MTVQELDIVQAQGTVSTTTTHTFGILDVVITTGALSISNMQDLTVVLSGGGAPGPPGLPGEPGEPGAPGEDGIYDPAALGYRYIQASPASTWTINHPLEFYPAVTVVDSSKRAVLGEVEYTSATQVVVRFASAFSGEAYLT